MVEALEKADRKQIKLTGIGCFAQVFNVVNTGFVIKEAFDHPVVNQQKSVYTNDLANTHIFYDIMASIALEMVFRTGSCLSIAVPVPLRTILRFRTIQTSELMQAAECLRFIYSKKVFHTDFGIHNFLIQEDGSLVLADFGGSMSDDTSPVVPYSTWYTRPGDDNSNPTAVDEIFALRTIIYEISLGHELYAEKSSREIRDLLRQHTFPNLDIVPLNVRQWLVNAG
ncbi:hypothetical protein BDW59DRAFT_165158 [Aspergillus cavernicola]|uniref:Protein kinase domain-containing protein n=1 Tax=Aspergillus cavernicola TaxID=176166 RepID=A0ABR4HUZ6_9EURO